MGGEALIHDRYLDSDIWKCVDAPVNPDIPLQALHNTGAHHWLEIQGNGKQFHTGLFYCKYCHDTKRMVTDWKEAKEG